MAALWAEFDAWPAATVFAAAEEAAHEGFHSVYRPLHPPGAPRLPSAFASGMNAGVLPMRLDRLRPQLGAFWQGVAAAVTAGGYLHHPAVQPGTSHSARQLAYSDQGVLNLLSAARPEWFTSPVRGTPPHYSRSQHVVTRFNLY